MAETLGFLGLAVIAASFAACVAAGSPATASPGELPSDTASSDATWDLTPLFADAGAWERERTSLESPLDR